MLLVENVRVKVKSRADSANRIHWDWKPLVPDMNNGVLQTVTFSSLKRIQGRRGRPVASLISP